MEAGIRPEDLDVDFGTGVTLRAEVEMISNVGAEKYIHTRLGDTGLTVRADKESSFKPGEIIPLFINPSRLHIFYEGRRV